MALETQNTQRSSDVPRDKPQVDRVEHANLERPGAQFHPRAAGGGWQAQRRTGSGWRLS